MSDKPSLIEREDIQFIRYTNSVILADLLWTCRNLLVDKRIFSTTGGPEFIWMPPASNIQIARKNNYDI